MGLEGIDHVALGVRDVAGSVAWYREVLGLERLHEDAWGDHPAIVGLGSTSLALFPANEPAPPSAPGMTGFRHVAFRGSRAAFEQMKQHFGRLGIDFEVADHGIAHSIYFRDPDGHLIEVTTYDL